MKTLDVNTIIIKDGRKFKRLSKTFIGNEELTVEYVKGIIKSEIYFPFDTSKEGFYNKSDELFDNDNVPFRSGNKYILTIK